jgi:hypothetical protein
MNWSFENKTYLTIKMRKSQANKYHHGNWSNGDSRWEKVKDIFSHKQILKNEENTTILFTIIPS